MGSRLEGASVAPAVQGGFQETGDSRGGSQVATALCQLGTETIRVGKQRGTGRHGSLLLAPGAPGPRSAGMTELRPVFRPPLHLPVQDCCETAPAVLAALAMARTPPRVVNLESNATDHMCEGSARAQYCNPGGRAQRAHNAGCGVRERGQAFRISSSLHPLSELRATTECGADGHVTGRKGVFPVRPQHV